MVCAQKNIPFLLLCALAIFLYSAHPVFAQSACEVSLSPASVFVNSSPSLTLTVANTGDTPLVMVYLYKPGAGLTLTGGEASGWTSVLSDESRLTMQEGSIPPGESQNFSIQVTTTAEPVDGVSFSVQATELADGNGLVECSGTAVVSVVESTAPVISDVTLSDVSESSVKVSWTTDHAASSILEYGVSTAYGQSKSDTALSTTHTFTLTGLSANTTYHAKISGTDADGFSGSTSDFTFATAASGQTVTETVTVNTTTTKTITVVAPAATPIPDTLPPKISLVTKLTEVFTEAPEISGTVTDKGGIDSIDFSTDGGKNWLPVDQNIQRGPQSVLFTFTPSGLTDGNYSVVVRSRDVSGNVKKIKPLTLVIDRLSPQIGGVFYSIGPFPIYPTSEGVIEATEGLPLKLTFSAVGGPTKINLFLDDAELDVSKQSDSGLWSTTIKDAIVGTHVLRWSGVDGAGNQSGGQLGRIRFLSPGKILSVQGKPMQAMIQAYVLDPFFNRFVSWNGGQYGQSNPQRTDEKGEYRLALPPGTYYLQVRNDRDYIRTNSFTLSTLTFLTHDFTLRPQPFFQFGPLKIPLLDLRSQVISLGNLDRRDIDSDTDSQLIGKEFPDLEVIGYEVLSLRGKASIVTLSASWTPSLSQEQELLSTLVPEKNMRSLVIMQQQSVASTQIFAARGNYTTEIIADPDGVIGKELSLTHLPMHYFLDRKGVISKVVRGELRSADIEKYGYASSN